MKMIEWHYEATLRDVPPMTPAHREQALDILDGVIRYNMGAKELHLVFRRTAPADSVRDPVVRGHRHVHRVLAALPGDQDGHPLPLYRHLKEFRVRRTADFVVDDDVMEFIDSIVDEADAVMTERETP